MYIKGRDIVIIGIALIAIGAVCLVGLNAQKRDPLKSQVINTQDVKATNTITYTGSDFKPKQTAIGAGSQVRFVNSSQKDLLLLSQNQEFGIIGTIKPGESKAFYFSQKGTWEFHNSTNEKQSGTLVIQ
jgi:hypothetical protein